jgi:uncharacterized membrane protein
MNLEQYHAVFVVGSLTLALVAAAPTLGMIMPFSLERDRFSRFWVLGPYRLAQDYPFNISIGENYRVFVGVGNQMGTPSYYMVHVKFGNQTQSIQDTTASNPSPLAPLYEYRAFVMDGGIWEAPLTFSVLEISRNNSSMSVVRLAINDEVFSPNAFSRWSAEYNGFFFQLFLELYLYDSAARSFQFHNRAVGIWLNLTA